MEKPSVCIRSECASFMDVEVINFKKLFEDIQVHLSEGLKLYKVKKTTKNNATYYEIYLKIEKYLNDAQLHQEKLSACISK